MGDRSEGGGERSRFFPYSRRIVDLCNENTGEIGPLSHFRSRFSHNPTASWILIDPSNADQTHPPDSNDTLEDFA